MIYYSLWSVGSQVSNGTDAASLINQLGLPLGFLVLTLGALRVMWKHVTDRHTETIKSYETRHAETIKSYDEALAREKENTSYERARGDRLEASLAELNKSVQNQVMPTLERATTAMAKELSRSRADRQ